MKLMPSSDRADKLPQNIKIYSLALRKAKGAHEWEKAIKDVYDRYFPWPYGYWPRSAV